MRVLVEAEVAAEDEGPTPESAESARPYDKAHDMATDPARAEVPGIAWVSDQLHEDVQGMGTHEYVGAGVDDDIESDPPDVGIEGENGQDGRIKSVEVE